MKRRPVGILPVLLIAVMLFVLLPAPALAAVQFTVDGIMYQVLNYANAAVIANGYGGDVTIPATVTDPGSGQTYNVTTIGTNAFQSCTTLTSVSMPSVGYIWSGAFRFCTALTSVNMPSVTYVGSYAFDGCNTLASVSLPSGNSIAYAGFRECRALKSVYMPNVTSIETYGFQNCTSLLSADMPKVTSIGDIGFQGCTSLASANMPLVTSIGSTGFAGCTALTSVHLPSVTSIGNDGFSGCTVLASVYFESSSMTAGTNVFSGCPSGLVVYHTQDATGFDSAGFAGLTLRIYELVGSVTISGNLQCGQTITAVPSGIVSTPPITLGMLFYQWTRDGSNIPGSLIDTYTLTADDVGKAINVTVWTLKCAGGVSSNNTALTAKVDPTYTVPTGLTGACGQRLADVPLPSGFSWTDPSTSVGNVGSHSFTITYTPADTAAYNTVTDIPVTLTVVKGTPIYTVPTGLSANYGDTLAAVTLPAGFGWGVPSTTSVGDAGNRSFSTTYTPTDTTNYNIVTGIPVTVTVNKIAPAYTVPTGLTAACGQRLSTVTLPAGFAWTNPSAYVGGVGSNTFIVTYTPADTTNYLTVADIFVMLTVVKGTPAYTVPTGLTAAYGQRLSNVTLPPGFSWLDPSISVGNAGSRGFTVTYTPADTINYNVITNIPVTVTVNKSDPSYTVPTGLTAVYGNTLADVTLPSGFSWPTPSASVGNAGSLCCTVTYTPADTANYNVVTGISVTVTVNKVDPGYTVPSDLTARYGETLADVTLPSGFSWDDPSTTSVGNVGSLCCTVTYTPADKANYNVVTAIPVTVTVNKIDPSYTVPTDLSARYGDTLDDVALPAGFSWDDPSTTAVGNVGSNSFNVTYTPDDTANLNTVAGIPVTIAVARAIPPAETYDAAMSTAGGASITLPLTVDRANGSAIMALDPQSRLVASGAVITVPSVPGVDTYTLSIPVPALSTPAAQDSLTLHTSVGSIIIPTNMLTGVAGAAGDEARITTEQGDTATLTDDVKAVIGDRPLIRLTLTVDGKPIAWNSPGAPVTVSIPYAPSTEELSNPESIVIWYIDGSGKPVSVPNGHYDPTTGSVTFSTTHFSDYAVGYNRVSFGDIPAVAWYSRAVSYIAAREITGGTGSGNFSPDAKLTRGDFLVLLMRAYGIATDVGSTGNFADAGNTYYTGYLAAAKRLGISDGVGNNLYAPGREITRQEMCTLLYRVLKLAGQLPQGTTGTGMAQYPDAGEVAFWAQDAMAQFVQAGIINGSDGLLAPSGAASRAEMAQVLYSLLTD